MTIELDHVIVSAKDRRVSARRLADLLGVRWAPSGAGPFSPVYVNDGLTLGFIDDDGIPYRSTVRGPDDSQVNTAYGRRMVYWNEPDGHPWEILTVSYARPAT